MRLPSVRRDVGGQSAFDVPRVVPFEDQRGRQLQQLGGAVQQAGMTMQGIAQEWQSQVDSAELQRADNLMADAIRQATTDYAAKRGADAVSGRQAAMQALQEARTRVEQTLQTGAQRSMFGAAADRRMIGARDEIDRHGLEQARVFHEGETLARAEGSRVDAVRTFGTPEFDLHRGLLLQQVDELANMRGLPPDSAQRQEMRLRATTDLHSSVVAGIVDQEPQRAAAYLQKVQGEIEPGRAAQLAQTVRNSGIKDESLRLSNRIIGEAAGPDGRLDMGLALGIAEATFKGNRISAEVYDATVARLSNEDRQRRQLHADQINQAQDAAEAWLQQNPNQGPQALPAALYTQLEQNGKLAEINAFADRGRRVTDPQALEEALSIPPELLGRLSPAEVRMRYRGRLSPEDLNVVMATHALAGGKATARDTLTLRENLEIELAAKDAGILPTDDKPTEEQATAFDRWRLAALQARELDPQKPLAEIVGEMQQQIVRARGEGTDVNFFSLPPEARKTSEVVTPSGRRIPLAAIVDEAGQPMAEQIFTDIRTENARRAAAGQPLIPETMSAVGAAWERYQETRAEAGLSSLRETMRERGMKAYSAGISGAYSRAGALVRADDAAALTGLTVAELRERMRAMDAGEHVSPFGSGVTGFPITAVARVIADLRKR